MEPGENSSQENDLEYNFPELKGRSHDEIERFVDLHCELAKRLGTKYQGMGKRDIDDEPAPMRVVYRISYDSSAQDLAILINEAETRGFVTTFCYFGRTGISVHIQ